MDATGGAVAADGAAGATGGVHPVGGSGSAVLDCTIFSRFSRTLKLKRRRFGFPRRPPSPPDGSAAGGSTAGGLPPNAGAGGGAIEGAGGAKFGAGTGPLVAGGKAGCPNIGPAGGP